MPLRNSSGGLTCNKVLCCALLNNVTESVVLVLNYSQGEPSLLHRARKPTKHSVLRAAGQ
jgi:hypothetical protein